ncbi:hypothetical protein KIN20_027022 [Parelaphostrongylus tenuis]|uniref:Uncharacterized protein n=1 Tax=Parelaphostrongylus tenuis TaxID=148309 RepID=A0AAD5WDE5_PARTN|nr:hypothetical protein KIN20_027022 [Parelaphostrongylus tenuis]
MDKIQAVKEQFQRKLEAYEKKNRLLSARVGLLMKEKEAAEELADGCLRDRVVMLANKLPDGPERTLKESLYAADNAVCAQCQINEEMRTHLADEVAEKKRLLEKCQKECSDELKAKSRVSWNTEKMPEKLWPSGCDARRGARGAELHHQLSPAVNNNVL